MRTTKNTGQKPLTLGEDMGALSLQNVGLQDPGPHKPATVGGALTTTPIVCGITVSKKEQQIGCRERVGKLKCPSPISASAIHGTITSNGSVKGWRLDTKVSCTRGGDKLDSIWSSKIDQVRLA